MKMTKEHYRALESAMGEVVERIPFSEYKKKGLSPMRYRWDMLRLCREVNCGAVYAPMNFVTTVLYRYLNDDHIDTALRRITGTK